MCVHVCVHVCVRVYACVCACVCVRVYCVCDYFDYLQQGKVVASAWLERKVVTVMSTNTQPVFIGTVHRRQKDGSRQEVPCPEAIIHYNKYMGGVDRGDQLRGYYRCRVKSRKFYKYIFYFLLDVAITNAYVLYNGWSPRPQAVKCIKMYRMKLAHELMGTRRRAGRVGSSLVPLPLLHYPVKVPPATPSQRKRGLCAYCKCTQEN